jgi:hypothetical protein
MLQQLARSENHLQITLKHYRTLLKHSFHIAKPSPILKFFPSSNLLQKPIRGFSIRSWLAKRKSYYLIIQDVSRVPGSLLTFTLCGRYRIRVRVWPSCPLLRRFAAPAALQAHSRLQPPDRFWPAYQLAAQCCRPFASLIASTAE